MAIESARIPGASAGCIPCFTLRGCGLLKSGHATGPGAQQLEFLESHVDVRLQWEVHHTVQLAFLDGLRTLEFAAVKFVDS